MVPQLSTAAATPDELAELVVNLFEQYASPLCAYLYRFVGDWELASDLAQETFLRLYQERHKLHNVENQRAWLYHIATDGGEHWQTHPLSGELPVYLYMDRAPGIDVAPDGTVDVVFYAHREEPPECLNIEKYIQRFNSGCVYQHGIHGR